MGEQSGVLLTKLSPPPLEPQIVRRPSLVKAIKRGLSARVLLLHAPTGYGKTTALSSFFHDERMDVCWYRLSGDDREWKRFCRYLVHALRRQFPSFGEELSLFLEKCHPNEEGEFARFLEMWVNQLAHLPKQVVLVLDDVHHIQNTFFFKSYLQSFISLLPSNVHLVLSTRRHLDWNGWAMMKVKGQLVELTLDDLIWSEEEMDVFVTEDSGISLSLEQRQEIMKWTRGWAVAVRLSVAFFSQFSGKEGWLEPHSSFMKDLSAYLKTEVWDHQSVMLQQLQEEMCLLHHWSTELHRQVFGKIPDQALLQELAATHSFLQFDQAGIVHFHPLYQRFVQVQFQQKEKEYFLYQKKVSRYYMRCGLYDQALELLHAQGEQEEIAALLSQCGREWIAQGQLDKLEKELHPLADQLKDRYEKLWLYEGEICRYRCQYEKALACYSRVERLAREKGDSLGQSLGLEGQARIYLDTIQPGKAEHFLLRAIHVLDGLEQYAEDQERLQSLFAENWVNIGRVGDADRWLEQSREINSKYVGDELEIRLLLRTGRLRRAKQMLEKKKQEKSALLPRSHRESSLLLSLIDCLMGEPDQAKKLAEAGIMQGVVRQAPFVEACGWMRMGHAVQLIPKYERRLVAECYQTALEMMDHLRMSRGKAEPLMGLSLLYGREGATDLAFDYGHQALRETEKVQDQWLSMMSRLSMGIAAYYGERWQESARLFAECSDGFVLCADRYFFTVTMLWQALTAYETEDETTFCNSMERLLKIMQTGGYEFLIQKRTLFGPRDIQKWAQLLLVAQIKGIEDSYATFLLNEMGFHNVSSHPGYTLRIQTLGDFRVWLGEEEVGSKDWQRGKAKELFQLLLTKRHLLLSKEEICLLLWPESDAKAAARDFKVALNALNNAVEPKRSARSNSFYIQRQGSLYGFNLNSGYELDAAQFEQLVQAGLKEGNAAKLQNGLELYGGNYLPERRYEDWCFAERERLQSLFIRGAERLAQMQIEAKELDSAIYWCERILQADVCWEEAHRLLMICFYLKNNRPQAMRRYQKCKEILQKELGVPPMPVTEKLLKEMIDGTFECNEIPGKRISYSQGSVTNL